MIPNISFDTSTSMLKFNSSADLRRYLKKLLDSNLRELDKLNDVVALFMRDESIGEKPSIKGWVKQGTVFINKIDSEKATLDVLFALGREIKPRVVQIQEALKVAEKLEAMGFGPEDALMLYTKLGMPERFVLIRTDAPEPAEKYVHMATYLTK